MRTASSILFFLLILFPTLALRAESPPSSLKPQASSLHALLPHDTLAFLELDPFVLPPPTAPDAASANLLDLSVQALSSFGVVPDQAAAVADFLRLASQLGQNRNCLALLDGNWIVDFETGGLTCRSVQLAWIIDVQGKPQDSINLLTAAVAHFSTQSTVKQTVRTTAETHHPYVEFYDTRWPDWLKLYWATDGNLLILTLGSGSMEHYLAAPPSPPVGGVPWATTIAQADQAAARHGLVGNPVGRLYLAGKTFRDRFPDVMKLTVLSRLARALDMQNTDAALLTARVAGRAIHLDLATLTGAQLVSTPFTVALPADHPLLKSVPTDARYYFTFNLDFPALYARTLSVLDAILSTDPTRNPNEISRHIDEYPTLYHVNLRTDIIDRLSPLVLVHDAPQHPLHIPLMLTILAAAKPGQEQQVQSAMKTLLDRAAVILDQRATADAWTNFRFRTDPHGITFLQYGLAGPAWTWRDRVFLFSWSPAAVRSNLPHLPLSSPDPFLPPK